MGSVSCFHLPEQRMREVYAMTLINTWLKQQWFTSQVVAAETKQEYFDG